MTSIQSKKLFLGIVGGGPKSWIGHVHRIASRFDNHYEIVAGVFSRNPKLSKMFGKSLGISSDRCYSNYKEMAEKESEKKNGINVVSIMTPPASHQIIAEQFINKNIHIISDKPFAGNLHQAKKLYKKIKSNKNIKYALTHNYSAYPMVRQAKQMVEKGKIGKIEYINVEYVQDWLKGINLTTKNAYHLAIYISGLKGDKIFADIKNFSKKIKGDANAQAMVNFNNQAKGMFWISSVPRGGVYGLKIRVFGSKGSLEWAQNNPGYLRFNPAKGAVRLLEKGFFEADFSKKFTRVKYGHPEGYLDAFANIYKEFAKSLTTKSKKRHFYPNEDEGLETAKFIEACKISSKRKKWVKI